MKRICVFCGSNNGRNPAFITAARRLGELLVERSIGLVYGGGSVGLMGEISKTVMRRGGKVIGVIPRALEARELANVDITELRVVKSMHERKALMAELSDAFIALPGGIGTLEEFAEIVTWAQLGIHRKPCGLLNTDGYFNNLIAFLDEAASEGFILPEHRPVIIVEKEVPSLMERIIAYRSTEKTEQWLEP